MKKIYLALVAMLISFNAHAFIISPHVGLDYVSATPNGFGDIDSLNGGAVSAGVKVLGFLSVEGYYQQYASTDAFGGSKTKPAAYGIDLVSDTLNLGVVELLTTVGYGKYTLDGGNLNKKWKILKAPPIVPVSVHSLTRPITLVSALCTVMYSRKTICLRRISRNSPSASDIISFSMLMSIGAEKIERGMPPLFLYFQTSRESLRNLCCDLFLRRQNFNPITVRILNEINSHRLVDKTNPAVFLMKFQCFLIIVCRYCQVKFALAQIVFLRMVFQPGQFQPESGFAVAEINDDIRAVFGLNPSVFF